MKQTGIWATILAAIAIGNSAPIALGADGEADRPETKPETKLEIEIDFEDPDTADPTGEEPEEPANEPLTRVRVERTLAEMATLVNQLLNFGGEPRPSVEDLVAYYAPLAQISYYYTTLSPNDLQCLTREQYRNLLLDLVGSFPDPLQRYRYDYRIDSLEIGPDGSEATVEGRTFETITINGRPVWNLVQAWAISLVPEGDRVLVQQEVSSEEPNLDLVPRCPRPDFMSGNILDRGRARQSNRSALTGGDFLKP